MRSIFRNLLRSRSTMHASAGRRVPRGYAGPEMLIAAARIEWDSSVVLSVARTIDSDADRVMQWFTNEPIVEFDEKTASQLIREGATAGVLDMLVAIRSGRRDL